MVHGGRASPREEEQRLENSIQREALHEFITSTGGSQAGEQGSDRNKSIKVGHPDRPPSLMLEACAKTPRGSRDAIDKIRRYDPSQRSALLQHLSDSTIRQGTRVRARHVARHSSVSDPEGRPDSYFCPRVATRCNSGPLETFMSFDRLLFAILPCGRMLGQKSAACKNAPRHQNDHIELSTPRCRQQ